MCGINGFNWKDEELIREMNVATKHRGPDATGTFVDENISLGNNRLSIIDLDPRSNQPMESSDGGLVIVYNGEIYNFKDIRREIGDSYVFKTESDTEVILAVYKKWGIKGFKKLNGMYAFAIWDKKAKELVIVRDPVGVKPLFYFSDGRKLIFSSEIKGILEADAVDRVLNKDIFTTFLRILYTPEPNTAILGIFKLSPGHYLRWKDNKIVEENVPFFDWETRQVEEKGDESKKTVLKRKIEDAVERQLVSDRPVGIYLSGGFDSSIVLSAMVKSHSKVNSYSVGFDLPNAADEEKFNADFNLARQTAQFYGTDHHELKISIADVQNNLEKILAHEDALISNATSIPMALLAEFTRKESVVVLSGDGGDELFGGYDRYAITQRYMKFLPFVNRTSWVKQQLFKKFMFQKLSEINGILSDKSADSQIKFFRNYFKASEGTTNNPAIALMLVDFQSWLPDQALALADQMSMHASLEQRVPLLDLEVVKFAKSLQIEDKVSGLYKKKILKESFQKDLPAFLFDQPKRGWFAPGAKWLRAPGILSIAKEVMSPSYYQPTAHLFNWVKVNEYLSNHVSGKKYHANILWAVLSFQIWARKYQVK